MMMKISSDDGGEFAEVPVKTSLASDGKDEVLIEIVLGSTEEQEKDNDTQYDLKQEKKDECFS